MDVGWLTSGPPTCRQLQIHDGDKSKLRDKGILKAVLNIIDAIAHKLLDMDVWEHAETNRTMVGTCFRCAEVLLQPSLISQCDADTRKDLHADVVLSNGMTTFQGIVST